MSKKKKIVFAEGSLDSFPEEEQSKIMEELKKLFEENDPETIGQPIEQISSPNKCPYCGEPLVPGPVLKVPSGESVKVEQIFDCEKCDRSFVSNPVN